MLTEVPGNLGRSIDNGHDYFTKYLEDEFRIDLGSLVLVHVWPTSAIHQFGAKSTLEKAL